MEHDYRQQSRRRIERQLRIGKYITYILRLNSPHCTQVKEDATDDEVRAAVDGGADQVFAQAVRTPCTIVRSLTVEITLADGLDALW